MQWFHIYPLWWRLMFPSQQLFSSFDTSVATQINLFYGRQRLNAFILNTFEWKWFCSQQTKLISTFKIWKLQQIIFSEAFQELLMKKNQFSYFSLTIRTSKSFTFWTQSSKTSNPSFRSIIAICLRCRSGIKCDWIIIRESEIEILDAKEFQAVLVSCEWFDCAEIQNIL